MTNRQFIDEMARSLNADADELQMQVDDFVDVLLSGLKGGNTLTIKGFGTFESKQKAERRMYNPTTKTFSVIPAKQTVAFKMGTALKEKINS